MKKALFALPVALFTAVTLASCGSSNETTTTTEMNYTTVMEGFTEVDEKSVIEYFNYYRTDAGLEGMASRLSDKNITSTYHQEKKFDDGMISITDSKRVMNMTTKDFTYLESHTQSEVENPYSYTVKMTGIYDSETDTWDCYIDYDFKNQPVYVTEQVYNELLDEYVETDVLHLVSESGKLKMMDVAIWDCYSGNAFYLQFCTGGFGVMQETKYYMNEAGDFQKFGKISPNDVEGEEYNCYFYVDSGMSMYTLQESNNFTTLYKNEISDLTSIESPDVSSYTEEKNFPAYMIIQSTSNSGVIPQLISKIMEQ